MSFEMVQLTQEQNFKGRELIFRFD